MPVANAKGDQRLQRIKSRRDVVISCRRQRLRAVECHRVRDL
jgi:hypothetical protein